MKFRENMSRDYISVEAAAVGRMGFAEITLG